MDLVGYCRIVSECHFSWDYPPGCMDWHLLSFLWNIWMMSACVLILVGVSYTDDMMKTRVFVAQEWSQCDRQTCLFWETIMLLQLKSKFGMQWLLACWLSENGVMNFPDFIRWIWHICGLECYCSEINVTWLCTVLDWFFSRSVCNHEFNIEWSSMYPEIVLGCVACVELVLWIHPVRKLYSIPISLQCLISHIYSLCNVRWALQKPSNGLI